MYFNNTPGRKRGRPVLSDEQRADRHRANIAKEKEAERVRHLPMAARRLAESAKGTPRIEGFFAPRTTAPLTAEQTPAPTPL